MVMLRADPGFSVEMQASGSGARRMEERMSLKLFRVILPVDNVEQAANFYAQLLDLDGERVSAGRHYFDCGGTILACYDPRADGDSWDARPNPDHVYFAVSDLEATWKRTRLAGCGRLDDEIKVQPWGERSFYAADPFGNKICFVDAKTVFTGLGHDVSSARPSNDENA